MCNKISLKIIKIINEIQCYLFNSSYTIIIISIYKGPILLYIMYIILTTTYILNRCCIVCVRVGVINTNYGNIIQEKSFTIIFHKNKKNFCSHRVGKVNTISEI
jgi:hypothetical protein